MHTPRIFLVAGLCAAATLAPAVSGCGSDGKGGTGPNVALYADWNVTSFQALGTDFIADGMTMAITFDAGGTYAVVVTNDLVGICDPDPNCITGGDFTATGTTVTLDPGSVDEVAFNYSIVGTTMTFTGSIGPDPVTITLERV